MSWMRYTILLFPSTFRLLLRLRRHHRLLRRLFLLYRRLIQAIRCYQLPLLWLIPLLLVRLSLPSAPLQPLRLARLRPLLLGPQSLAP
jgi:hypothetical protein